MIKKTNCGYCVLDEFTSQPNVIHGFSTRKFGDCNPKDNPDNWKNIERFLLKLRLEKENLVLMEQVHGNKIKVVDRKDRGKIVPGIDGMMTDEREIILGVKTADCLPILSYDPVVRVVGVVHAGWQGVLKKVAQKMIDLMIKIGTSPEDIVVGIGPHIRSCCYDIKKERAERFIQEFGRLENMIKQQENKIFLNLEIPTISQLVLSGVLPRNIRSADICTSCQNKEFFSYRKDNKKTYGEILGIIGLIN